MKFAKQEEKKMGPAHFISLRGLDGGCYGTGSDSHVSVSHLITAERRTPQLAHLLSVQTATRLAALLPL